MEQLCPVCQGHGIVPQGFYMYPAGQSGSGTSAAPEKCRRCGGVGTIGVVGPVSQLSPEEEK